MLHLRCIILLLLLSGAAASQAQTEFAGGRINYEGRLTDDKGDPLPGPVDITLKVVLGSNSNCSLYVEKHSTVILNEGFFSIQLGGGTRVGAEDSGLSMTDVFKNNHIPSVNSSGCSGGNPVIGLNESRYLKITIDDGTNSETLTPNQMISAVPAALRADVASKAEDADTLQGSSASDFAGANHNHDSQYAAINSSSSMTFGAGETLGLGQFDNAAETTLTGSLSAADEGKTWYNSDTGLIMYWDGTTAQAVGSSAGGISSINGDSTGTQSLSIGSGGTTPAWSTASGVHTLNIPLASSTGVTAGLISKASFDNFSGKVSPTDSADLVTSDISGSFNSGLIIKNDAVDGTRILDGTVDTADLADESVTLGKIDGTGATALQGVRRNAGNTAWEFYTPTTGDVSSSRTLAAGNGLIGGGDLSVDRTFNIGAGTGIVVNADDIAVNVGTTAGKIVQLDGTGKLPAVDGSRLTGIVDASKVAKTGDSMSGALTMATQSEVRFADAAGGEYVSLKAPATVGTSYNLTLPAADGNPNDVLQTNGSGTLSWTPMSAGTPAAGGAGQIQFNSSGSFSGDSLFVWDAVNTRLGIGTAIPDAQLQLRGASGPDLKINSVGTNTADIRLTTEDGFRAEVAFRESTDEMYGFNLQYDSTAIGNNFNIQRVSNGAPETVISILRDVGDVGIGTDAPGAKLEVAGQVKITGGAPGEGKVLTSDAAGLATWQTLPAGGIGDLVSTNNLSDVANAVTARANLGLAIGANVQAYDVDLDDLADGTLSASKVENGSFFINSAGIAGQVWTSDGIGAGVWSTSTNVNTASTIVKRDASGNFSAGTITANLTGNVAGNVTGNVSGTAANVTGTVAIANGGTGQTTAAAAFNALAPIQSGSSGKFLKTDGTNTLWASVPGGSVTSVATGPGLTGGPITGAGTISIAPGGVSAAELATGAVTTVKILDNNVTDAKISAVGVQKITSGSGNYLTYAPNGTACTNGQVLKWNTVNTRWECGSDSDTDTGMTGLTGDVTASGSGSVNATVASVGGVSAVSVASGANLANAATETNTAGKIVKRDATGNFSANMITANLMGNVTGSSATSANLVLDSTSNAVKGNVILNGSGGNVGIGTATPQTKLEVNGSVRIGDGGGEICSPSIAGTQRYNSSINAMEYCNGSAWVGTNGITSCPSGFSMVGQAGRPATFCIMDNVISTGAPFGAAKENCETTHSDPNLGTAHLCTHSEFHQACTAGGIGDVGSPTEMVDDILNSSTVLAVGGGSGCNSTTTLSMAGSNGYRCCLH